MPDIQKQQIKANPKKIEGGSSSNSESDESIVGLHVYGNLYGLDPELINDQKLLEKTVLEAVKLAKMTLVEHKVWSFGGKKGGVSVMALITESHMVLHTWNEYKYATLDIYTCGAQSDPYVAFDHVVKVLKPKKHQRFYADRSSM